LAREYFNLFPDADIVQKAAQQHALLLSANKMSKAKTLQSVVVKTRKRSAAEIKDEEYTSGLFSGGLARAFDIEKDRAANTSMNILQYLRSRVAGLDVVTFGMNPGATRRGAPVPFFLDEMPVAAEVILTISMSDIAYVKVIDPPFVGVPGGGAGGAISVYLKRGSGSAASRGLNAGTIQGYSPLRDFYMPDYDKTAPDGGDYRSTLYWNPFVIMDAATRTVTLPVFNSSNCKKIKVVIEGMNELGQLTREEKVFE